MHPLLNLASALEHLAAALDTIDDTTLADDPWLLALTTRITRDLTRLARYFEHHAPPSQ